MQYTCNTLCFSWKGQNQDGLIHQTIIPKLNINNTHDQRHNVNKRWDWVPVISLLSASVNLSGSDRSHPGTQPIHHFVLSRGRATCNQSGWLPQWASTTICGSGGNGKVNTGTKMREWLALVCVCVDGEEGGRKWAIFLCFRRTGLHKSYIEQNTLASF